MIHFSLTKEQWEQLQTELNSLYGYHWGDDSIHARDCGSKVLSILESQVNTDVCQLNPSTKEEKPIT